MSKEQVEDVSEGDSPQYDFEEFISRYRKLEDEISEHRRVTNIQTFAGLGAFAVLLLLFAAASRSSLLEKENLPQFLLAPINAIEGVVNFIETNTTPILDTVPLVAWVLAFVVLLRISILFANRRDELGVDNREVFKARIAGAAASLGDSPHQAVKDLRSAIDYGSPRRVLPKYQIEQTREFLDNVDEIETEEEAREKVGIVIEELTGEFEEESAGRIARINENLRRWHKPRGPIEAILKRSLTCLMINSYRSQDVSMWLQAGVSL